MNDATKAPARIWVNYKEANRLYVAYDMPPRDEFDDCRDPYILATPAALAASPEVAALIREAEARGRRHGLELAASTGYRICAETRHVSLGHKVETAIRAEAASILEEPK